MEPITDFEKKQIEQKVLTKDIQHNYGVGRYLESHVMWGGTITNIYVKTTQGEFVVKLFKQDQLDVSWYMLVDKISAHLTEKGISVPRIVSRIDGSISLDLDNDVYTQALVLTFLPGRTYSKQEPLIADLHAVGGSLRLLHNVLSDVRLTDEEWDRLNHVRLVRPQDVKELVMTIDNEPFFKGLGQKINESWSLSKEYLVTPLEKVRTIAHRDYGPSNILFSGGEVVGVLDLYSLSAGSSRYDQLLSSLLFYNDYKDVLPFKDLFGAIVDGYEDTQTSTTVGANTKRELVHYCWENITRVLRSAINGHIVRGEDYDIQPIKQWLSWLHSWVAIITNEL